MRDDLKASIVVFLVALPLCLGIALASGAPLVSGLIAGIVGGIVVGTLSDSHVSVSGPAAGLTVLVAAGITQVGGMESFAIVVMMAGLIQILFGFLRGGAIGDFFPAAVIKGMLAAIGLILIIKQLPTVIGNFKIGVLIISAISFCILIFWGKSKRLIRLMPAPLAAVIASVILNELFSLVDENHLVQMPQNFLGELSLPKFDLFQSYFLMPAFTIAVIASLESLLSIESADKLDKQKRKTNKNRELFAQGAGNLVSGFFSGLPVTAVIVRTSANVNAGAKSKKSAIFHSIWLLLCVLFIPGILNMIPLATLGCVLLIVGYNLIRPVTFIEMKQRGMDQLFIFCSTIAAIVITDLLIGIFIGLVLAFAFEFKRFYAGTFEVKVLDDKLILDFKKDLSFFHRPSIAKHLENEKYRKIVLRNFEGVKKHVDIKEMVYGHQRSSSKIFIEN